MKKLAFIICLCIHTYTFSQNSGASSAAAGPVKKIITDMDFNERYIWVGTNEGLYRISKKSGKEKFYSLSNTGSEFNYVTDIFCLSDGCVWIATNNGLLKYDNFGFISYSTENSDLPENIILSVTSNSTGDIVVGTAHYGVMILHKNRFRHVNVNLAQAGTEFPLIPDRGRSD
jgi:ligand-binding sensor domain-containing protein